MSNISNYVAGCNEALTAGNYNEQDAAVFSAFSYFKFENYYSENDSVKLTDVASTILQSNTGDISEEKQTLLESIINNPRYANCTVHNMQAEDNPDSQWAAMTIDIDNSTSVIAMRGTDGTTIGWDEDFRLLYDQNGTAAQQYSAEYLKNCDSENIYLTGHSKGGNDVISSYLMSDSDVRDKVTRIENFDGPGVNTVFKDTYSEAYSELDGKLNNYYPKDSIIGQLLNNNPGESHFIDADSSGTMGTFYEHSLYNWYTNEDGSFKITEQSEFSKYMDKVLDYSVDDMSYEERITLYSLVSRFQIPGIISKEDRSDYIWDDNAAMFAISGFITYATLTPWERYTLDKAICSIIVHTVEVTVIEEMSGTMEYLIDQYHNLRDTLSAQYEEVKHAISDFCDNLYDYTCQTINTVIEYIQRTGNDIFGHSREFSVSLNTLLSEADQLSSLMGNLNSISERINTIKNQLDDTGSTLIIRAKLSIISNAIIKESKKMNRLSNGLNDIYATYTNYENQIISFKS